MRAYGLVLFGVAALAASGQDPLVRGNNRFAFDLYARLKSSPGNLVFSPYSISTALAMTYAGARAGTASQMARVLHFELPADRLHAAFRRLIQDTAHPSARGYELSVANGLWLQNGFDVAPPFLAICRDSYGAALESVDFMRAAEDARRRINAWTERETQSRIRDLIPSGLLSPLSRLVLTNAIYFKGKWASPFKPASTREGPFTLLDGSSAKVPLMHQLAAFPYADTPSVQVLELPYAGEDVALLVLLPKDPKGFRALESTLSEESLLTWLAALRVQRVSVTLPRFTIAANVPLTSVLQAMGMTDAFTAGIADFTGISKGLQISEVMHKAMTEVNEQGTEAAAATAVEMSPTAAAPVPLFNADRPFLFLIRHLRTGSVLFAGRLLAPAL